MNGNERERVIAERSAKTEVLQKEKRALIKEAIKLLKKPGKRKNTREERFTRAIALIAQAKFIEFQQYKIISQPLPRHGPTPTFKNGAVVVESGPEMVATPKGLITVIPNGISVLPGGCIIHKSLGDDKEIE